MWQARPHGFLPPGPQQREHAERPGPQGHSPGSTRSNLSDKQPGLPPQPCFHGPLGALPRSSRSPAAPGRSSRAFRTAHAQEARRLSPAAPGGPRVAPLRTGSTAWAGLPGPEAAGPPRTRAPSASSLTRPEKAARWVSTLRAGPLGETRAWGRARGGRFRGPPPPPRASPALPVGQSPLRGSAHTPHVPLALSSPG